MEVMVIREMSGHLFVFGLALLVFQFTVVQGQSTIQGFTSIDCGLPKDKNYNDKRGIPYISDSEFIDTGESNVVSSEFYLTDSPTNYLRSFPNGTRNCYNIRSVVEGWLYLVRARFLYGNYDGKDKLPRFDLYLGINYWTTVSLHATDSEPVLEILAVAVSNSISICLVNTNQGTPFISSIDLRRLPNILYPEANVSQSLDMLDRQNLGGQKNVRYPEDTYDRFWFHDDSEIQYPAVNTLNTSSSILTSFFTEPSGVMQSLAYPKTTADLSFGYYENAVGACPSSRGYFVFYFAELEKLLPNESRILHVSLNGIIVSDEIQPEYLKTTTFDKSVSFSGNLNFSVAKAPKSAKPPILNAFEIYRIIDMTCQSETRSLDVDVMMDIKSFYKVQRNWNGDPCAPVAHTWEGLNCSYNGSNSPSIISLNLSSSGLTGTIPASLVNLTSLQYLDLSSNSLTGEIPDFLSRLAKLEVLNLANNNLTGSIPKVLVDMSTNGQLNLSTGGNQNLCINPDTCPEESSKKSNKILIEVLSSIVVWVVLVLIVVSIIIWIYIKRKRDTLAGHKSLKIINKHFTYRELKVITENFKNEIGRGGFGRVFFGAFVDENNVKLQVAVKLLKEPNSWSNNGVQGFLTETKILTTIHHINLVTLIGYCGDSNVKHLALVYEYIEGGSLADHLSGKKPPLSWRKRLQIAFEVAQGLDYLHKHCKTRIIHRDIKPDNILLTKDHNARIADFGLSMIFQNDATHFSSIGNGGTLGYKDPEYEKTKKLRDKSDVYSFGVVLMELITGLPAMINRDQHFHITQWVKEKLSGNKIKEIIDGKIKEEYDEKSVRDFVKIAQECTENDSSQRPDTTKVVEDLNKLCTDYDKSRTPTSCVNQEQSQADVVGTNRENAEAPSILELVPIPSMSSFCQGNIKFTYSELGKITDNFKTEIGSGRFGQVFHGVIKDGIQVAVKLSKNPILLLERVEVFQKEAKLLTRIRHAKLVPLFGYCDDAEHLALVYEYMEGGSLEDNLLGKNRTTFLSWRHRLRIACDVAQGLKYLQKDGNPSIAYRDVRTRNILLTKNLEEARIADYGFSKMFRDDKVSFSSSTESTSSGNLDPYSRTEKLRAKSDLFSFGVVLMELITGLPAVITISTGGSIHITNWIQKKLSAGSGGVLVEIFDEKIKEEYDEDSVSKFTKIAQACTVSGSLRNLDISEVVEDLEQLLIDLDKSLNQE